MRFFISYASDNRALAEPIAFSLRNRGHTVFFDKDDLPPGQSYDDQIHDAILAADFFIFLISPESVEPGRFTLTEIKFARKKWPSPAHRVLPVMAIKTDYSKIPSYLKSVTTLNPIGNLTAETSEAAENLAQHSKAQKKSLFKPATLGALAAAVFSVGLFKGGDLIDIVTNQSGECTSESTAFIQEDKDLREFSGAEIEERTISGQDLLNECNKYPKLAFQTKRIKNLLTKYQRTSEAHSHLIKMKDFIDEANQASPLNLNSLHAVEHIIETAEDLRNTFQKTGMHHFVDGQSEKQAIAQILTRLHRRQNAIASTSTPSTADNTSTEKQAILPIFFLDSAWESAKSVARIQLSHKFGTGFLISENLLLTTSDIIPNMATATGAEAEFDYYITKDGLVAETSSFDLDAAQCFLSNQELGYSIVALDRESGSNNPLSAYTPISFYSESPDVGSLTSVIHLPQRADKAVSLLDGTILTVKGHQISYNNVVDGGASGAPVFNQEWKAIGLHQTQMSAGEKSGVSSRAILKNIQSELNNGAISFQNCKHIEELKTLGQPLGQP